MRSILIILNHLINERKLFENMHALHALSLKRSEAGLFQMFRRSVARVGGFTSFGEALQEGNSGEAMVPERTDQSTASGRCFDRILIRKVDELKRHFADLHCKMES